MKLTKFEHACFVVEEDGKSLVVDPGVFTTDFVVPQNTVAVVITHEHPDHFDESLLQTIVSDNPGVVVVGHPEVVTEIKMTPTHEVLPSDTFTVGPFSLEFFGGEHAIIHPSVKMCANVGVMINDTLYYPGDSFSEPDKPVAVLAVPVGGPWMKTEAAMDFLKKVVPKLAFPTHDAVLSDIGKASVDRWMEIAVGDESIRYERLSESVEI